MERRSVARTRDERPTSLPMDRSPRDQPAGWRVTPSEEETMEVQDVIAQARDVLTVKRGVR
jgi:hypothetical protein